MRAFMVVENFRERLHHSQDRTQAQKTGRCYYAPYLLDKDKD